MNLFLVSMWSTISFLGMCGVRNVNEIRHFGASNKISLVFKLLNKHTLERRKERICVVNEQAGKEFVFHFGSFQHTYMFLITFGMKVIEIKFTFASGNMKPLQSMPNGCSGSHIYIRQ